MVVLVVLTLASTLDWNEPDVGTGAPSQPLDDHTSTSERTLHQASSGILERWQQSSGLMNRMRDEKGGDSHELSADEQDMLQAMADQFRVHGSSKYGTMPFGTHGTGHDTTAPPRSVSQPPTDAAADSIQIMTETGSVTASGVDGKVVLRAASGTNDGGVKLLSAWCPDWQPVCAADGHSLPSACWARSVGLEVSHPGRCPPSATRAAPTAASMVEAAPTPQPMSRLTLAPSGLPAGLADAVASDSEIVDPVCGCPLTDGAPVCGSNGKTYESYCWARCAKTEVASLGPCKKPF